MTVSYLFIFCVQWFFFSFSYFSLKHFQICIINFLINRKMPSSSRNINCYFFIELLCWSSFICDKIKVPTNNRVLHFLLPQKIDMTHVNVKWQIVTMVAAPKIILSWLSFLHFSLNRQRYEATSYWVLTHLSPGD